MNIMRHITNVSRSLTSAKRKVMASVEARTKVAQSSSSGVSMLSSGSLPTCNVSTSTSSILRSSPPALTFRASRARDSEHAHRVRFPFLMTTSIFLPRTISAVNSLTIFLAFRCCSRSSRSSASSGRSGCAGVGAARPAGAVRSGAAAFVPPPASLAAALPVPAPGAAAPFAELEAQPIGPPRSSGTCAPHTRAAALATLGRAARLARTA
mmetsp:Transcript_74132/g.167967  ORF Transcript_74132/g.167967 Transcript_74132/m.167967 type:complete len:210 (+) Transcript_74132:206-835(+)